MTQFLDKYTASASTAEAIYGVVDAKLRDLLGIGNPWEYCTSVAIDNASVNIGIRNSLSSLEKFFYFLQWLPLSHDSRCCSESSK